MPAIKSHEKYLQCVQAIYLYLFLFVPFCTVSTERSIIAFRYASMTAVRPSLFLISGEPIDIMKPRAVAACNDEIARDVVKLIREADQRVDMKAK